MLKTPRWSSDHNPVFQNSIMNGWMGYFELDQVQTKPWVKLKHTHTHIYIPESEAEAATSSHKRVNWDEIERDSLSVEFREYTNKPSSFLSFGNISALNSCNVNTHTHTYIT